VVRIILTLAAGELQERDLVERLRQQTTSRWGSCLVHSLLQPVRVLSLCSPPAREEITSPCTFAADRLQIDGASTSTR
jgi:hypothetical protein